MNKKRVLNFFIYVLIVVFILIIALKIFKPLLFNTILENIEIFSDKSFTISSFELILFSLFSLLGFFKCFELISSMFKTKYSFHSYKEDNFKNILWKWSWSEKDVLDLWCYCPTCQTELTHESDHLLYKTKFSCVECEKELLSLEGDNLNYILAGIKKEIKRISIKKYS